MNSCKNCNELINGNYCSNCGQPAKLKRIGGHYIVYEIRDTLFVDGSFWYTIKKMITRPGESVRKYVSEDRSRLMKPISFLIISSLIYTVVMHFFQIDYFSQFDVSQTQTQTPTIMQISHWMIENRGYTSLIVGLSMAFWVKLFFRKSDYNIFEIFILLCFTSGINALWMSVVIFIQRLLQLNLFLVIFLIPLIYHIWSIGQFFGEKKAGSYIKAILSYFAGIIVLGFIAVIGTVIELIVRN